MLRKRNSAAVGIILAVFAGSAALPGPARSGEPKTVLFTGVDVAPRDSVAAWGGAIYAFNGLAHDSVYIRAFGGHAWYEYTSGASLGIIEGRAALFDAMIGYQVVRSNIRAALSVGVDYQDHDLSPDDPGNRIRGSETGFKVMGDVGTLKAAPWFFDLIGSYSTAFDSYWARGRVGYEFHKVVIGPEAVFYGNSDFEARRFGGFVQFDIPVGHVYTRTSIAAGHEQTDDNGIFGGREGAYGTLNFAFAF